MAVPPALMLIACLALGACGTDDGGTAVADSISTTTAAPTTTSAPTTTVAKTTTTTEAPTTTAAETTTTVIETTTTVIETTTSTTAAPPPVSLQPVTPPAPRADEAHVELGTIEIPKIGVSKKLLEGITLTTLDKAPGHWPGTAMPGQVGNVVVAGHRTSHDKPFRKIDQLVPGDEVIFTTPAGRFVYLVTGTEIVAPDAVYIVNQTATPTATLFACHPPGSTRQRIVVHLALQQ